MTEALNNPAVQSALLPLALTLISAPILATLREEWAAVAIPVGFVAGYVAAVGLPPLPPISSTQKIPYLVAAAVLLGGLADRGGLWRRVGAMGWILLALGWLSWPRIDAAGASVVIGIVLAGVAFALSERRSNQDHLAALLVASLAFAGVAFLGSSASIAQGAGALAASTGGLLLWSWPKDRWPRLGLAALLGTLGAFALLAQQALLYTKANPWALACLVGIFLVPSLPLRFPARDRPKRAWVVAAACVPLALAAIGLAWRASQQPSLY